ncbi:uncharacterized protein K02A2.6-like [Camponotus floridanus]|uniref:uncharacterized protein K02A2.6-like n=1 Tax=Camponotus floridanus TaxID=104421 RepID=UPI000DC6996C|nr:uncharacterized protein K02A2.6-like [Camponotus floridanus]
MKKTFEDIKNILTGPLLLAHYDPRQTLIVAVDASSIGIGGVLLQRAPDGQVKAVFHMSKALTKTQQNYSQIEKKALALVTAVERFRKFVYGRHFVLQTDHRPLLVLFKTSNTKGLDTCTANRLKRWALRLIGYDFDIEYVNSEKFGQADALSRLIQDVKQDVIDADLEEVVAALQETDTELQQIVNKSVQFLPSTARQELQSATFSDGILAEVIDRLQNGWLKSDVTDKELMSYYRRRDYLAIVDNTLVLDEKLIIPKRLQSTVLKQLHVAHPGPIHGQWVLVIVDSYSKFVEAGWFSTITAATCRYLRRLFSQYGSPEVLVSDNGTQFTSVEFAQLCVEFRILHLRTPPGHPQLNGQAERMIRTLKSSIDTSQSSQLETELNKFVYAYNYTSSDAALDYKSPAEFFGRKLRTPLDIFTATEKSNLNLTSQQKQMKQQFDAHHGARPRSFIESARIQSDPVLHTSLGEREEAEPLNNGTIRLPVASARRSENPSRATQPPVAAARRSEHLSHQIRPNYKAVGGTRPYRGQHS